MNKKIHPNSNSRKKQFQEVNKKINEEYKKIKKETSLTYLITTYFIVVIAILGLIIMVIGLILNEYARVNECKPLENTCEYYKCQSKYADSILSSNNMELKYQSCLMEKKDNSIYENCIGHFIIRNNDDLIMATETCKKYTEKIGSD